MSLEIQKEKILSAVRDGRARGLLAPGNQRLPPMTPAEEDQLLQLIEQVRDRLIEDKANADSAKRVSRIRADLLWLAGIMPEAKKILTEFDGVMSEDLDFVIDRFSTGHFLIRLAPVYQEYTGAEVAFSKDKDMVAGPFVRFVCAMMRLCGLRPKPDGIAKAIVKYRFKPKAAQSAEERFAPALEKLLAAKDQ